MKNLFIMILIIGLTGLIHGCGSSGGSSNPVSVVTAPVITSVTPANGGPGTLVTILGQRFGSFQGTSIVNYSGVTVTPSSWTDNMITLVVPANAQNNGTFQVIVNGQVSNQSQPFTVSNPQISFINPQSGSSETQVTISGQSFGPLQGNSYVSFNGQHAQIISWSNSSISCQVPGSLGSQSGSVSVIVMVDGARASNTVSFNLTAPLISTLNPAADNIGALVTIFGDGFGQSQSEVNGQVTIGGQSAQILSWTNTTIQIRIPNVTVGGAQSLVVTVNGRQSSNSFEVAGPVAESFYPNPVGKDERITINGRHFGSSTDIVTQRVGIQDYGQVSGVSFSDTSLSFTWPVENDLFGTQQKTVTIDIGGLTTTIIITAD